MTCENCAHLKQDVVTLSLRITNLEERIHAACEYARGLETLLPSDNAILAAMRTVGVDMLLLLGYIKRNDQGVQIPIDSKGGVNVYEASRRHK